MFGYFLINKNRLMKGEYIDEFIQFLVKNAYEFKNCKWEETNSNEINDRFMGCDPYEESPEHWIYVTSIMDEIETIDEDYVARIINKCVSELNIKYVYIDYFQLIHYGDCFPKTSKEYAEIIKRLKKLAKDLNIAIILLSQVGRSVEKRDDTHPLITDVRNYKATGKIANKIFMIYREGYYCFNETDDYYIEITDVKSEEPDSSKLYVLKRYNYNEDL